MEWVKASERKPEDGKLVFIRAQKIYMVVGQYIGERKFDGKIYPPKFTDFSNSIKLNWTFDEIEWLSDTIESCATSSENYWKQRCEAAEDGLRNLIFTAQKLWDDAKPIKDTSIIKVTHPAIEEATQILNK